MVEILSYSDGLCKRLTKYFSKYVELDSKPQMLDANRIIKFDYLHEPIATIVIAATTKSLIASGCADMKEIERFIDLSIRTLTTDIRQKTHVSIPQNVLTAVRDRVFSYYCKQ